jgi:hypothetical protein
LPNSTKRFAECEKKLQELFPLSKTSTSANPSRKSALILKAMLKKIKLIVPVKKEI